MATLALLGGVARLIRSMAISIIILIILMRENWFSFWCYQVGDIHGRKFSISQ